MRGYYDRLLIANPGWGASMVIVKGVPETDLRYFLLARESDIAFDIEDFGDLKNLFHLVFDRWPQKGLQDVQG